MSMTKIQEELLGALIGLARSVDGRGEAAAEAETETETEEEAAAEAEAEAAAEPAPQLAGGRRERCALRTMWSPGETLISLVLLNEKKTSGCEGSAYWLLNALSTFCYIDFKNTSHSREKTEQPHLYSYCIAVISCNSSLDGDLA